MFVTVRNGPDDAPQPMAVPLSHFSAPPGMAVAQHGPARRVVVAQPPFATQAAYANPNDTMKTLDERFRALSAQRSQSVRRAEAKARQAEARQSALAAQRKVSSAAAPSAPPSASARAGGKQTGGGGSTRPSSTAANGSKSRSKPAAATSSAKKPAAAAAVPATPPIQSRLTFPGGAGAVKGKAGAAGGATGAGSVHSRLTFPGNQGVQVPPNLRFAVGSGGAVAGRGRGARGRGAAGVGRGGIVAGRRGGAVVAAAGVRTRATAARTAFGATMFGLGPRGLVPRVFQTWQSLEDGTPVVHARCARFCVPSEVVETMKKQYSRFYVFREVVETMKKQEEAVTRFGAAGAGFYVPPEVVETMKKQEEAVSRQVLRAAKAMCEQFKVSAEADVIEGEPRESICDAVEQLGVQLLVIGSHGYGTVKRAFLGSVSDYCVHHAACPVVVVRKV
ncbi:unnamed protein product [Closterium sp. NIES-65]|nr:unnamed protein product [Closterium sp. NIES-65]